MKKEKPYRRRFEGLNLIANVTIKGNIATIKFKSVFGGSAAGEQKLGKAANLSVKDFRKLVCQRARLAVAQ